MNIKRKSIGIVVSVLYLCILAFVWPGRSSASPTLNPNCQPVSVTPQDQNFSDHFLSRINNQRPFDYPVRPLAGAENAANYIAQYIAADPSAFDTSAISNDTLIGDCPLGDFLSVNVVDGAAISIFIPDAYAYDLDKPTISADELYELYNQSTGAGVVTFMQDFKNVNVVREVGVGYAQVDDGDHYTVFVLLMSQTRGESTIPSAHYTPNEIAVVGNDPLYDTCIGTPASTNDAFGEDFGELEERLNNYLVNNQLRSHEDRFNQGDQTVRTIMDNLTQYLAEDMAHDYYVPFDPFSSEMVNYDTNDWIVNRDENGGLVAVCDMRAFVDAYFEVEGYDWTSYAYFTLDNFVGGVDEAFDLLQQWGTLQDTEFQYMGIGYAKTESGSARLAIVLVSEPSEIVPTPTPIPVGILPTPMRTPEGQGGSSPIDCQPSNGSGGFVDNNGDPIMPGEIAETTIFGHPVTVIVGDGYDPDNPTLMTFYLHGDEGNYQVHNSELPLENNGRYYSIISDLVRENGWIYVAPQAPVRMIPTPSSADDIIDITPPWHPWYGGVRPYNLDKQEAQDNMNTLKELFLEVRRKYNVCQNMSLGSTASGGSYFYDGLFFPMNGEQFPAFVNVHCGSGGIDSVDATENNTVTPWNTSGYYAALESMATNSSLINQTELSYVMNEQDDRAILWPNIWYSIRTYEMLGFNLQREVIPETEHCKHSIQQVTADYWEEKFTLIQSSLPTPIPTDTPIPDTPVPTPIPDTPVPTPIPDTPVPTPIPDTPVPTPIPDTPVPTPIPDTPVPTPIPDTPVPTPIPDTPVPTLIPDTPVPTPIPDTPVPTLIPDTPVPTPIPDTPVPTPIPVTPVPLLTPTPEIPLAIQFSDAPAVPHLPRFAGLITAVIVVTFITAVSYKSKVHDD